MELNDRGHQRPPLLQFREVTKRFGGNVAVDGVSFDVEAGSVLALLGENGAGKSTLIKTLAGIHQRDGGEILFEGRPLNRQHLESGEIAFIHQDLGLVDWMTVAENMAMVMGYPRRCGVIDWRAAHRLAAEALALVHADIDPRRRVSSLSRSEQSLLAIARAIHGKARLLILDEPTASLPAADVEQLFQVIRDLRRQGVGMIYVSHRLDEIMMISDSLAVMRDGRLVAAQPTAGTRPDQLVELIVGKAQREIAALPARLGAAETLDVEQLRVGQVGPVSFGLREGEILGLVGLRGGGQEEVGRALFGDLPRQSGQIRLAGKSPDLSSPAAAIASGIAFVAGDRCRENLAMSMSIRENLFLNPQILGASFFSFRSAADEIAQSQRLTRLFDVRPDDPDEIVENLSGGNQQKVVMARWLNLGKPLLILEEPTAGVDVGAKGEIYALLQQAARAGTSILIVSTDFEEVEKICSRCLVFSKGRIAAELEGDQLTFAAMLQRASLSDAA